MAKRSQITIFFIIGIVLIFIFGVIFFLSSQGAKTKVEQSSEKAVESLLLQNRFDYYVNLCVDKATKDAIELISMQGGRIYPGQPGSILVGKQDYALVESTNVSMNILALPIPTPKYPCITGTPTQFCGFANSAALYPNLSKTSYGLSNMLPLCKTARDCNYESVDGPFGTSISIYGTNYSIQAQMEKYIENVTKDCVRIDQIEGFNSTFTANYSNVTAHVFFDDRGVTVTVNFPMEFKLSKAEPVTKLYNFTAFVPVRLKPLYMYARYMIEQENRNLSFNYKTNINNKYYRQGFQIEPHTKGGGNILVVINDTDTQYNFKGKNFSFQFLMQNRPPALNYLSNVNNGMFYPELYTDQRLKMYFDYVVMENTTITINPTAKDPDDANITYNYSGWKETYDEAMNESCAIDIATYKAQEFYERDIASKCLVTNVSQPRNWTKSQLFRQTSSSATYTTTRSDIGWHNITVTASDGVLKDWQVVWILVTDKVKAFLTGRNLYDYGLSDNHTASVEDPYMLNGTLTNFFAAPTSTGYDSIWDDSAEPGIAAYYNPKNSQNIALPDGPFDVKNMADPMKYFTIPLFTDTSPSKIHNISYTAVDSGSSGNNGSMTIQVTVYQCIPYGKSEIRNQTIPPYPYNKVKSDNDTYTNNSENPFLATHSCCYGRILNGKIEAFAPDLQAPPTPGKVKPSTEVCYEYSKYGCYEKIVSEAADNSGVFKKIANEAGVPLTIPGTSLQNKYSVYEGKLVDACTGNRGNICSGKPVMEFREALNATPINAKEHCSGCNSSGLFANENAALINSTFFFSLNNKTTPKTTKYSTYENITGLCNDSLARSSGFGDKNYSTNKPTDAFLCQATCGSTGCSFAVNCKCGPGYDNVPPNRIKTYGDAECEDLTQAAIYEEQKNGKTSITFRGKCCSFSCNKISDDPCS